MITRVGSISLDVPDLDASVAFFEQKVGLVVTETDGQTTYLRAAGRHHDMVLNRSADGIASLKHLNFEVEGDLDAQVQQALDAGATDIGPVQHPGVDRAHLVEIPGGFGVKLYQGMHSAEAPEPSSLTRPYRFSHFNIAVPEVAPQIDFFIRAFGMKISDWIGSVDDPLIGWLHCDVPRASHHGVAILRSENKLHHIAFDFDTIGDVAARVDNYVDESHYLVWGMGRHGTGGSVFAYIEDPSGMMVELDTGMIVIGDDPRWDGPREWALDDPRGIDEWGSALPEAWLAKRIPLRSPRAMSEA